MNVSQGERFGRMEAILERIEPKIDRIERKVDADVADLASLKNKGAGILIGVAIASATIGASASSLVRWLVGIIG